MTGRTGTPLAATVAVLAGYLVADIFLDGLTAAVAVLALGVAEFLVLLITRKEIHSALIFEALILAGAVFAGDHLSSMGYRGAQYAILEILLGGVLLATALAGRPWLASQMKRLAGMSPDAGLATGMSVIMGGMLLFHGILLAVGSVFFGGLSLPVAVGSFAALYVAAVVLLRRHTRSVQTETLPRFIRSEDEVFCLILGDTTLATMTLEGLGRVEVSHISLHCDIPVHEAVSALERALAAAGAFSVTVRDWDGDTLPLEIAGYVESPRGWTRVIGRRPTR